MFSSQLLLLWTVVPFIYFWRNCDPKKLTYYNCNRNLFKDHFVIITNSNVDNIKKLKLKFQVFPRKLLRYSFNSSISKTSQFLSYYSIDSKTIQSYDIKRYCYFSSNESRASKVSIEEAFIIVFQTSLPGTIHKRNSKESGFSLCPSAAFIETRYPIESRILESIIRNALHSGSIFCNGDGNVSWPDMCFTYFIFRVRYDGSFKIIGRKNVKGLLQMEVPRGNDFRVPCFFQFV